MILHSEIVGSASLKCAAMDDGADSQGLLQSVLGYFARKHPQSSAKSASLSSRKREAWLRTDAFLQRDGLIEAEPESIARTLGAIEHLVADDFAGEVVRVTSLDIERHLTFGSTGL